MIKTSVSIPPRLREILPPIVFVLEDSVHRGYKLDSFSHTRVEDLDTDFEHTIEVLAEQHMDSAVECKHCLEVDYIPSRIYFEGNK